MREVDVYYVRGKYPVFTTFLNNSLEEIESIKEKITKYRKENPESNFSNVKAWHSHYRTQDKTNMFDEINQQIVRECNNIVVKYFDTDEILQIYDMWINVYKKGNYTKAHCHAGSNYSCCYYVDVEENSSPIKFFPRLEIKPKNDMLVFFHADLYHEVLPTNGKRTLIAMNLEYPKPPSNMPSQFKYS